jgi:hypothetical protein
MLQYLDPNILGLLLLVSSGSAAIALLSLYILRQKEPAAKVIATSDWPPAALLLRVEDYRTVESISGVEHMEIRWRNATLAEAKSVVTANHNATEASVKTYHLPKLVLDGKAVEPVQTPLGHAADKIPA